MALDKATIRQLSMQCRRALKKPLQFVYCPEGADGNPVLIIDKNIKPQLGELKNTAKRKKFVQGELKKSGKALAFYPVSSPDKLGRDLKNTFGKAVPLLKGVRVVTPDEAAAERKAAGRESAELSALAGQIGSRAAKFRANPSRPSEANLTKLLERIKEYQKGGGKTNFSGLRKEIRKELARREQEGSGTEGSSETDSSSQDSSETDTQDTGGLDLNAEQATIGRLAARFRSSPSRPNMKQLRQLRDRIKAYQKAGGTIDFSLLLREMRDEVTRRREDITALQDEVSGRFEDFQQQRSQIEAALSALTGGSEVAAKRTQLRGQLQTLLDDLIQQRDRLQSRLSA